MTVHDHQMTPQERRATWGLGALFSLRMLGMFMVLPVLTTYGMALSGATTELIGLAIGIYGLTQALFQIPLGLLSDRFGRKPLIVLGLLVFALGSIIAATTDSIWGVILGRALQGAGAIAAAVMALLSDLTREQNRTKAMAFIGISFGLTFAIAMVLGPLITHSFGLSALFWFIAILALSGIVLTLYVIPSPSHHLLNRESNIVTTSIRYVLTNSHLVKLNLGIFCLHVLLMSFFVAIPNMMQDAGFPTEKHGAIYLITMLFSFIAVLPAIIYAEKQRQMKRVFLLCIVLLLVAETILGTAEQSLWTIFIGIQFFFIAFNILEALLPSMISKEAPAGYKGTALGIYSTAQFLGVACGGTLGGWLTSLEGTSALFIGGVILSICWFLLSLSMKEPPYLSSLRLELSRPITFSAAELDRILRAQSGVTDVLVAVEEQAVYVKVDQKITSRQQLTKLLSTISI